MRGEYELGEGWEEGEEDKCPTGLDMNILGWLVRNGREKIVVLLIDEWSCRVALR